MSITNLKAILCCLFLPVAYLVCAQQVTFYHVNDESEWEEALEHAQSRSLQLFLDLYTDWCGYCKMMDREVFSDQEVGGYLNSNFINVKINAETGFGSRFVYKYEVSGYPTYLFLASDGDTFLGEIVGYNEKHDFLNKSRSILASSSFEEHYSNGTLGRKELMQYACMLYPNNEAKALEVVEKVGTLTRMEILESSNLEYIILSTDSHQDPVYQFIEEEKTAFVVAHGKEGLEAVLGNVYNSLLSQAIELESLSILNTVFSDVLPLYVDDPDHLPESKFATEKLYYAYTLNWDGYLKVVEEYSKNEGAEVTDFWYLEAYEVVEDYSDSDVLMKASFKWLDKALQEVEDYETYYLYAYALGIYGELNEAREKAVKAKDLARDSHQRENCHEFIAIIDEQ